MAEQSQLWGEQYSRKITDILYVQEEIAREISRKLPLDEREQAFASLEKAYAAHDLQLQYLGVDPAFNTLRSDPRFQDIVRRVGLPQ